MKMYLLDSLRRRDSRLTKLWQRQRLLYSFARVADERLASRTRRGSSSQRGVHCGDLVYRNYLIIIVLIACGSYL